MVAELDYRTGHETVRVVADGRPFQERASPKSGKAKRPQEPASPSCPSDFQGNLKSEWAEEEAERYAFAGI